MKRFVWLALLVAGCADPCADLTGEPSLELGGASMARDPFTPFEPGSERELVPGGQGGMHVWLTARIANICPRGATFERRAVDDASGETYYFASSEAHFRDGPSAGVFDLVAPEPMFLCPNNIGGPVLGHPLRFVGSITDTEGRHAEAELAFVPVCPDGVSCETYCGP